MATKIGKRLAIPFQHSLYWLLVHARYLLNGAREPLKNGENHYVLRGG